MIIEELLAENNIPMGGSDDPHTRKGWVQLHCPFCINGQQKFHLGYNLRGRYFNCWKCGPKRTVETLVQLLGVTEAQAKGLAANLESRGIELPRERLKVRKHQLVMPRGIGPLLKQHKHYLTRRGFKPTSLVKLWHLQGIGISGQGLSWRIFIPIYFQQRIVSWTTRSIHPEANIKYMSAPPEHEAVPLRKLLYGVDYCRHVVIVVEGPADVWNVGPGAAATLGTSFTNAKVAQLAQFPNRIVCFDNEPEAQDRAEVLCSHLEVFSGTTHNVVLDAPDPGSAAPAEIRRLRRIYLGD